MIMALDVSLCNTGVAIIDKQERVLYTECIRTEAENKARGIYVSDDQVRRITHIANRLAEIADEYEAVLVVAEMPVGGGQGIKPAEGMGIAKAIVACFTTLWDLPLMTVRPTDSKLVVTGKKTATKAEMIAGIVKRWPMPQYISKQSSTGYRGVFEHIADALAAYLVIQESTEVQMWRRN